MFALDGDLFLDERLNFEDIGLLSYLAYIEKYGVTTSNYRTFKPEQVRKLKDIGYSDYIPNKIRMEISNEN
jgi:hypothetical protein